MCIGGELGGNRHETIESADGCASDNEGSSVPHKSNDAIPRRREPAGDAGIQNLVGGCVPTVLQNERSRSLEFVFS